MDARRKKKAAKEAESERWRPQHYDLPKEMHDGYHEKLAMKRIMEIYHPESLFDSNAAEDDSDAEDEELGEEPGTDKRFSWSWQDNDQKHGGSEPN